MGVFRRGNKLWITFRDVDGNWKNRPAHLDVGQEELAEAAYEEVVRRVREALRASSASSADRDLKPDNVTGSLVALTVRAFAEEWIPRRRAEDLDWKNDESRLRTHVLPRIGDMRIADVRTRHILELFRWRRTTPLEATGEMPSPRLIYNIYSVVSALFRDAKLDDRIEQTPCCLDDRQLGPLRDSDPEWRAGAVFTREEAQTLISDERIPWDRRMVYAFGLLAGMRPGEAAALRWRHYDATIVPLGKLVVALSYNTRKNKAKGTKTDAVRIVPVHPTLAAMLAEWKLGGWAEMVGRAPGADDLIVPLPPKAAARRRTREGDAFRGHDYSGKRWREVDLPALGWRYREPYATKSTFITLAIEDGARADVIRDRVTHTAAKRDAFSGYDRGPHWLEACGEVAKLRLARATPGELVSLPIAASGESGTVIHRLSLTDERNFPHDTGNHAVAEGSDTAERLTATLQPSQLVMSANENSGGGGSRTRGGRPATTSDGARYQTLALVPSPPRHVESRGDVRTPLQVDADRAGACLSLSPIAESHTRSRGSDSDASPLELEVASRLAAAHAAWIVDGDRRALRRALLRLVTELEDE